MCMCIIIFIDAYICSTCLRWFSVTLPYYKVINIEINTTFYVDAYHTKSLLLTHTHSYAHTHSYTGIQSVNISTYIYAVKIKPGFLLLIGYIVKTNNNKQNDRNKNKKKN